LKLGTGSSAASERMKIADLDDVMLQRTQDGLLEFIEPIALEIVKQRDAELLLVRALNEAQVGLQNCLLVRFEITEQVGLNRWGKSEG